MTWYFSSQVELSSSSLNSTQQAINNTDIQPTYPSTNSTTSKVKMKLTIIATTLLSVASAAAVDLQARGKTCTATWTGSNSEGGGGPGQAPINNNAWSLEVTGGGKKLHTSLKQTGKNGVIDHAVTKGQYGGNTNFNTHAQWNYGGNSWYRCSVKKDGKEHAGKVDKQHISTGTVSVTTDKCHVTFPC